MKILFCEVENYGKISGRKIVFDGNLPQFCEDNGKGKTTLCSFLRVMFYGMETRREKDVVFGDREHFYPFSGGRFGGSVTFLYGGKTCRIERFFDEKSATKDTFRYFENDEVKEANPSTIGKEIFGMDEEAFGRSLLFDSRDAEISATVGMREKLGAVAEGTGKGGNAADAIALLEKKRKEICGDRKNANSEMYRLEAERAALDKEIDSLKEKTAKLDYLYTERARLQAEISSDEKTLNALREKETLNAKKETYLNYLSLAQEQKNKREELQARYPAGVFTEAEIDRLKRAQNEEAKLKGVLSADGFPREKSDLLCRYEAAFASGVPSEETIQGVEQSISELGRIEAALSTERGLNEREKALFTRFDGKNGAESDFSRAAQLSKAYRDSEREIVEESAKLAAATAENVAAKHAGEKKKGKSAGIFAVAGALLLLLGAVLCFVKTAIGVPVIVVGCISLLLAAKNRKTKDNAAEADFVSSADGKLAALKEERGRLAAEIGAFLTRYGYPAEEITASLDRAANDYVDYLAAKKSFGAYTEERRAAERRKQSIENALTEYFAPYRLTDGAYSERLRRLKNWMDKYADLREEKRRAEERTAQAAARIREIETDAAEIFAARRLALPQAENMQKTIGTLSADSAEYARCVADEKVYAEKAAKYLEEQKLPEILISEFTEKKEDKGAETGETAAAATTRLNEKRGEAARIDREIMETEAALDRLAEKEKLRAENDEKYADAKARLSVYRTTTELIRLADDNLMRRYVEPVRGRFVAYADLIEKELGWEVTMNRDFSLSFSRGGARRKDGHLSAGVRSVCAFCLRLSLIDEMFAGREQPFLILDDPFVHLDEEHFNRTAALVRKIAEQRQLIYFTCHSSRKVVME